MKIDLEGERHCPGGGKNEARRPLGGLAELGEGSHLSPSKYAPTPLQSLLLQTSGKYWDKDRLGALRLLDKTFFHQSPGHSSCPIFHFQP